MALLTKAMIVAVNDAEYDTVSVPEWGGDVRIRSLFGDQRTRLSKSGIDSVSYDAMCCAMGIVDDQGNQLFTEAETAILAKKHPWVLDRICNHILALSKLTPEARAEAEKKQAMMETSSGGSSSPEQSTIDLGSIGRLSAEAQVLPV